MKIGFFYTPNQLDEHRIALKAMHGGVSKYEDCFFKYDCEHEECDVSVNWGIYKMRLPYTETRQVIHDKQQANNKKSIIIESGYLKRDKYYAVGYNGLNGRADFKNKNCSSDRWNKLGIDIKDYRSNGEHILLCGQVPWDAAVQHIDYNNWCLNIIDEIKSVTDRPIIFRPHPKVPVGNVFTNVKMSNNTRLIDDLKNCWAVVALNSNALVESVIEGVPVFACDKGAMSLDVSNNIIDLESPVLYNREQWAYNIAYSQWTLNEMYEGDAWWHLK
tara:strand:- start:459 stop:1280 length:822 start_codon:yes stop_codon:yes gene_type:complete